MNKKTKDKGDKFARELYREQVQQEYDATVLMQNFLIEARERGFSMRVHIEVDGIFCPSGPIQIRPGMADELFHWLGSWVAGVRIFRKQELDEMSRMWPEIPSADLKWVKRATSPPEQGGGAGIAPEGG